MKSIEPINNFFNSQIFAVIGISRKEKNFGNYVYKQMKQRDFSLVPVHYELSTFYNDVCYNSINDAVKFRHCDAAVILVSKQNAIQAVTGCLNAGITNIWLQQGSESDEIIELVSERKLNLIYGECIIMFLDKPGFGHQLHKFINKMIGIFPK